MAWVLPAFGPAAAAPLPLFFLASKAARKASLISASSSAGSGAGAGFDLVMAAFNHSARDYALSAASRAISTMLRKPVSRSAAGVCSCVMTMSLTVQMVRARRPKRAAKV